MNSTKSIMFFFVAVLFCLVKRQDALFCYICKSNQGSSPKCLMPQQIDSAKLCNPLRPFCAIKTTYTEGDFDPKTFNVTRGCADSYQEQTCHTVNGVTTCSGTCNTNFCNNYFNLNTTRPRVSGARRITTTPPPATTTTTEVVRQRCYSCSSNNGNNSACENIEFSSGTVPTQLCPSEAPYCATRVIVLRSLPGRGNDYRLDRKCTHRQNSITAPGNCLNKRSIFAFCLYPCTGNNCNNLNLDRFLSV